MESQDRNAQRTEGPVDYRHPVESSYILRENTISSESVHGLPGLDKRSRSEKIRELRQLGAVEFCGTIDPARLRPGWENENMGLKDRIEQVERMFYVDYFGLV